MKLKNLLVEVWGDSDHYIHVTGFFWKGSKSTIEERGASAIFAQRVDDKDLGGAAVQVLYTACVCVCV